MAQRLQSGNVAIDHHVYLPDGLPIAEKFARRPKDVALDADQYHRLSKA